MENRNPRELVQAIVDIHDARAALLPDRPKLVERMAVATDHLLYRLLVGVWGKAAAVLISDSNAELNRFVPTEEWVLEGHEASCSVEQPDPAAPIQ